jgi:hypothetical protein
MDGQLKGEILRRGISIVWVVPIVVIVVLSLLFFHTVGTMCRSKMYVRQKTQFNAMGAAIELFKDETRSYPPSDANDPTGQPYCGAMKLAEALMGQDLLGCHAKSVFRRDGLDATGSVDLYPDDIEKLDAALGAESLKARMGPYLAGSVNAYRLANMYGKGNTGPFPEDTYVLCDIFERMRPSGVETGMPILYYRANRLGTAHRTGDPNNVYDSTDNLALLALGVPGRPRESHPLIDPNRFYLNMQNPQFAEPPRPYRADSYILVSAGRDGLYGTADDTYNFEPSLRRR